MSNWLINESKLINDQDIEEMERELADAVPNTRSGQLSHNIAVSLHDIVIFDNKKWFGEADIRIDTLIITGCGVSNEPSSFYMPKTARFSGIKDGSQLPIGDGGLLIYYGKALHFIDICIMISRDRKDTDNLISIFTQGLQSKEGKNAFESLVGLSNSYQAPEIMAAISSVTLLGNLAYKMLRNISGNTIGLYRNTHLQYRDRYGIGLHPGSPKNFYLVNDLSFRYEITLERNN